VLFYPIPLHVFISIKRDNPQKHQVRLTGLFTYTQGLVVHLSYLML